MRDLDWESQEYERSQGIETMAEATIIDTCECKKNMEIVFRRSIYPRETTPTLEIDADGFDVEIIDDYNDKYMSFFIHAFNGLKISHFLFHFIIFHH